LLGVSPSTDHFKDKQMQRNLLPLVILGACLLSSGCESFNPPAAFESSDGRWGDQEILFKGRDFKSAIYAFHGYKIRCHQPNVMLVRVTPVNHWNFLALHSYRTNPKWRIPYATPSVYYADGTYPAESNRRTDGFWWVPTDAERTLIDNRSNADIRRYEGSVISGKGSIPEK